MFSINDEMSTFVSPSAGRLQSTRVNTINGRFESKIVVTFILFGGDQMDKFLQSMYFRLEMLDHCDKNGFLIFVQYFDHR